MLYFFIYLAIINVISFIMFFVDKRKARKEKWRIKESSLHLVSFAGGVYGSIAAMLLFHHKTKKVKFCVITALAFAINVFALVEIFIHVYKA